MNGKAYIIHLERAVARRPQAVLVAQSLPVTAELLPAVDGRSLSHEAITAVVRRTIHQPRYPFKLRPSEVGCFLSHRLAWQSILDDGIDAGLVTEDDIAVASPDFQEVIRAAFSAIQPDEVIRFPMPSRTRGEGGTVARTLGGVRFLEPSLPNLGMQMQLVGREAARRMLEASSTFDRPVDSFQQMRWIHGARVLSARPVVIRTIHDMLGGSVIQNKNMGFVEKAFHELQRPILRLAVRAANSQWRRRAA